MNWLQNFTVSENSTIISLYGKFLDKPEKFYLEQGDITYQGKSLDQEMNLFLNLTIVFLK